MKYRKDNNSIDDFSRLYLWEVQQRMQMRGLDKILLVPKFQIPNLSYLILSPLNNPLIRLHGPNSAHLLIGLDPLLLKLLNGFLKLNPNSFIAFGRFDDPGQAVLGFYSQSAETVV